MTADVYAGESRRPRWHENIAVLIGRLAMLDARAQALKARH